MSQRPVYTLEDIPVIHQRSRKEAAAFRALLGVAALQADLDAWLKHGDALAQHLAQAQVRARDVDLPTDRGWGGFRGCVQGWLRALTPDAAMPLTEEEARLHTLASELERSLIGDSLGFLASSFVSQWREMDQRLRRLDAPLPCGVTAREAVEALGLTPLLKRIQRLQAAYTEALGFGEGGAGASPLGAWEDALAHLDAGIRYFNKDDAGKRDALLAALAAPFVQTVGERRAREDKARARRDAASDAANDAAKPDAAKPATSPAPSAQANPPTE